MYEVSDVFWTIQLWKQVVKVWSLNYEKDKEMQDMKAMREEMENKFQKIYAKIDVATLK
jgi:hypothetical protein